MTSPGLEHAYLPREQLAARSSSWWDQVLGVVGFEGPPEIEPGCAPIAASMTPALGGSEAMCEVWRVTGGTAMRAALTTATRGHVQYRCAGPLLFGSLMIDEAELSDCAAARSVDGNGGSTALMRATDAAYREIFELTTASGYPHLVRVWNYLAEINRQADGEERYRQFNSARKAVFQNCGRLTAGSVPAASALGSKPGSPLSLFFLAAREPPLAIENPRQVSAYHYPPQYGEHSPLFSRASLMCAAGGTNLFVSGTASIVGHETRHPGDAAAQTSESLANIAAVVDEANRLSGACRYALDRLTFKVYVRRPGDLAAIAGEIERSAARGAPIVYLQADVCRAELLVEIEASGASMLA
jgi:enamine deaminase RidA (YjgF/YER057c/UK114 family)